MISFDSFLFRTRVIFTFGLIFILTILFVLPGQSSRIDEQTGDNSTPDLSFYYTVDELYGWAESYGEHGRESYIRTRFTFDLIWPLIYSFFLISSIGGLLSRSKVKESIFGKLVLLPILSLGFDYLENISTSLVMWRYPLRTPLVDFAATVFTPLKWIVLGICFVVLFYGLIRFIYVRVWSVDSN